MGAAVRLSSQVEQQRFVMHAQAAWTLMPHACSINLRPPPIPTPAHQHKAAMSHLDLQALNANRVLVDALEASGAGLGLIVVLGCTAQRAGDD